MSHYDEFGGRQVHCGSCGQWTYVIDPSRATTAEPSSEMDSAIQKPDGTFVCSHCGAEEVAINWVPLEIPEESAVILEDLLRRAHDEGDGLHSDDAHILQAYGRCSAL